MTMHMLPTLLIVMPLAVLPFAGCFGSEPVPLGADAGDLPGAGEPNATSTTSTVRRLPVTVEVPTAASGLPSDFTRVETVIAGVTVFVPSRTGVCSGVANGCYHSLFTIERESVLRASLNWTHEFNDFDLHLYRNGVLVHSSAGPAPGVEEALDVVVPFGQYDLVVVAYVEAQDSFLLAVDFSAPPTPDADSKCQSESRLSFGVLRPRPSSC